MLPLDECRLRQVWFGEGSAAGGPGHTDVGDLEGVGVRLHGGGVPRERGRRVGTICGVRTLGGVRTIGWIGSVGRIRPIGRVGSSSREVRICILSENI